MSNNKNEMKKEEIKDMVIIDSLNVSKLNRDFLHDLKKGEVSAIHMTIGVWENARETLSKVGEMYLFIKENQDLVKLIKSGEDILIAKDKGRIGIIMGTQNSSLLEDELSLVEVFNELGVKIMQLTYNNQSLLGSGKYEKHDSGLTRFGKLVIEEMNRVGMVVDLSHVSNQTSLDAIEHSSRPVSLTHANPDWVYPKLRSASKEVLQALRDKQGMLGLTLFPNLMNGPETTLDDFCNLVEESVEFMGIEQVGIGSDMIENRTEEYIHWLRNGRWTHHTMDYGTGSKDTPGLPVWPNWFKGPSDYPNLANALYKRGFTIKEVRAVMGENWLNFFKKGFQMEKYI